VAVLATGNMTYGIESSSMYRKVPSDSTSSDLNGGAGRLFFFFITDECDLFAWVELGMGGGPVVSSQFLVMLHLAME
jgi:hypothetical protein